ncbi:MAG TPA: aminotransferase class I/II-fold pyridoxal phosphate-dependent enzyme, partial [Polyangiaceae bacterium]|nr:aminotransferase class I/II-fold pyridoxal phosphate-dependent enzyme [Polyangiaceae bacterium]
RYRAFLVVDEAHALGVFGPQGAGLCAAAHVMPDVLLGTFGKAVGTHGAFAAGSQLLRTFLWNRARTFVFSTASSPELCARTHAHLQATREADARRAALAARCAALRQELAAQQVPVVAGSFGPIVPVLVGSSARATRVASALRERGILAQPIRPPTVPEGTARIRITVSERWADTRVGYLARCIGEACRA